MSRVEPLIEGRSDAMSMHCGAGTQPHRNDERNRTLRKGARGCFSAIYAFAAVLGAWEADSSAQSIQVPFYNKAQLAAAVAVQAANQQTLLASDGVRGVGIGQKD